MALSEFEMAFYDWYNQQTVKTVSMEMQREIFKAGWDAGCKFTDDNE